MIVQLQGAASELFEEAINRQAAEIAQCRLYDGTAAIKEFRLTRAALRHISETYLPGRVKPLYSARAIHDYLVSRESKPRRKATNKTTEKP